MASESEIELIKLLQNDDCNAFDRLFLLYGDKLYRFAFSLLKNHEDAENIVQEVFLRIWYNRAKIDTSRSFKSFLFTVAYNLIIDELRLRLKDRNYLKHLEKFFNVSDLNTQHNTDYNLLRFQVYNVVKELPEKRRMVYLLSRESGYSNKEIAAKLGISLKTVENQINLANKYLKIKLGKELLIFLLYLSLFG